MCGKIRRTLKGKTRKETLVKFYKGMVVPVLHNGSEVWVLTSENKSRIQAEDMKFLSQ